ncbi:MAG TPA: hypothetical protein RMH99_03440 [Sandaracinaceae bacterium LLY-WYZ-13_1]|nr:hypothetical protein [Sandaracinaceae bacterium LLY-WYZ-13_1]
MRGVERSERIGSAAVVAAAALVAVGCFVPRTGTRGLDGAAPRQDAGTPNADASRPPVDAGETCEPADARCDGTLAIRCEEGRPNVLECAPMGHCVDDDSTGPRCAPNACTPGALACSADGAFVTQCNAEGTGSTQLEACSRGCEAGACRAQTPCGSTVYTTTVSGSWELNLCDHENTRDYRSAAGCGDDEAADGPEIVVRLEVDRRRRYRVEAFDRDDRHVDPVVYVRSACDDGASQIACDDQGGAESDDASLEVELDAGDHFVVFDTKVYGVFGFGNDRHCGDVELAITPL